MVAWKNSIYVATDRGVEVYHPEKNEVYRKLNSSITTALCVWEERLVALVYGQGLIIFHPEGNVEELPFPSEIKKVLAANDRLFILTEEGVFEKQNGRSTEFIFTSQSVLDLAYLAEKGLAVLHRDGDLSFVDLRFSVCYGTEGAAITALTRNDTVLFIASGGKVIGKSLNGKKETGIFSFPGSPDIVNLIATGNKLFAGSFDQGLFSVDLASGASRSFTERDGLRDNSVLGMAWMHDTLWFSTLSGLAYLAPDGNLDYLAGINSTYIYDLFAADEVLWIGTDGVGLLKKEGSKITSAAEELNNSTVYRISRDGFGNLRCITKENGVYEIRSKEFSRMALPVDYEGYTSFGCGPANTTLLLDEGKLILTKDGKTAVYSEQSGFGQLSDAYLNTFTQSTAEAVYFASGTKVYQYRSEPKLPDAGVSLVEATSDFEPLHFDRPEIAYDANNLIFKMAAPWYRNPENIEYRYRLKGLEEDFRRTKNPDLTYPNLPYGEYVLEAQAGYNGIFNTEPATLIAFKVNRPFYLNPWIILSAIILIALIIYFIVKIRVANINRLRLAEKRMVESELAVLRTQVNPHFLFNSFNTLMSIIEPDSKAGAEYLEKLSDFYRRILEENKSQVITIEKELKILEEYIFLQKKRFGEAFSVDIKLSQKSKSGIIPALTFQLLAENALKHNLATRSRPLRISIEEEGGAIIITNLIRQKRKESESTGMGLENIRSRYKTLFGKKIEIVNDGKTFKVKLPKINPDHARTDT
jgi:hypothetical protein